MTGVLVDLLQQDPWTATAALALLAVVAALIAHAILGAVLRRDALAQPAQDRRSEPGDGPDQQQAVHVAHAADGAQVVVGQGPDRLQREEGQHRAGRLPGRRDHGIQDGRAARGPAQHRTEDGVCDECRHHRQQRERRGG
ncbi:MAG: hypothetical protein ACXWC6_07765, partial [Ramlibacter sp.]